MYSGNSPLRAFWISGGIAPRGRPLRLRPSRTNTKRDALQAPSPFVRVKLKQVKAVEDG
jgi:hypothetical protein